MFTLPTFPFEVTVHSGGKDCIASRSDIARRDLPYIRNSCRDDGGHLTCRRFSAGSPTGLTILATDAEGAFVMDDAAHVGKIYLDPVMEIKWRFTSMKLKNVLEWSFDDFCWFIVAISFAAVCSVGCYSLWQSVTTKDRIARCDIESKSSRSDYQAAGDSPTVYVLYGRREWKSDLVLFISHDRDEAQKRMAEIPSCKQ